jgi:hypothetical protein
MVVVMTVDEALIEKEEMIDMAVAMKGGIKDKEVDREKEVTDMVVVVVVIDMVVVVVIDMVVVVVVVIDMVVVIEEIGDIN